MQRDRAVVLVALACLLAPPALAQALDIGNRVVVNSGDPQWAPIQTDIDLARPATRTGSVTTARLYWSTGCTSGVTIKFFRRVGDTLTMTAQRGPFNTSPLTFDVPLSPPVSVQQGDLIGLTRLAACGNAGVASGIPGEGFVQYSSDVAGSVALSAATFRSSDTLALSASGTATERVAFVLPVVGSTQGGFGSNFRTELQILNPDPAATIEYFLDFHPVGAAGFVDLATRRSITLEPMRTDTFPDIVASISQTGLGTIDVGLPADATLPVVLARVYNDAGANGTSSLTYEAIPVPDQWELGTNVLARGAVGFLVAPGSPARTRFNIGVRTLYSGAKITVKVRNSLGVVVRTFDRSFTASYFQQTSAAEFLGMTLAGSESIQINVDSGSIIVYGSATDNVTNDPSIQFARGLFGIL